MIIFILFIIYNLNIIESFKPDQNLDSYVHNLKNQFEDNISNDNRNNLFNIYSFHQNPNLNENLASFQEIDEQLIPDYNFDNSINYDLFIKFNKTWPSDITNHKLGILSSMKSMDAKGLNVFVLSRNDRIWNSTTFDENNNYRLSHENPISTGVLIQIINGQIKNTYLPGIFYLPHGFTIDDKGNYWITDVALHQVFKFSPQLSTKPLLELGQRFKPGQGMKQFCKPTDVAVASNGHFFVSDGYCNNRIMKFDSAGNLIKSWGQNTLNPLSPGPYDLNLPHQLALFEDDDLLCVADRENFRIVCYTAGLLTNSVDDTGLFISQYVNSELRPVYGLAIEPTRKLLFALLGSSIMDKYSKIDVINLETMRLVDQIENKLDSGFGDVHTITTCPSSISHGCIIFCNTNIPDKNQSINFIEDLSSPQTTKQRIWLYQLLFV